MPRQHPKGKECQAVQLLATVSAVVGAGLAEVAVVQAFLIIKLWTRGMLPEQEANRKALAGTWTVAESKEGETRVLTLSHNDPEAMQEVRRLLFGNVPTEGGPIVIRCC